MGCGAFMHKCRFWFGCHFGWCLWFDSWFERELGLVHAPAHQCFSVFGTVGRYWYGAGMAGHVFWRVVGACFLGRFGWFRSLLGCCFSLISRGVISFWSFRLDYLCLG